MGQGLETTLSEQAGGKLTKMGQGLETTLS